MIKVNLSTAQKQVDLSNLGGIDFSQIKIKVLLLVIFLIYVPDFVIYPAWEESLAEKTTELTAKNADLNRLKRKITQNQDFEKQMKELNAQEENFKKKREAVITAISEKKNPSNLLLYISKNIPAELWIKELELDNNIMILKGEALDYTSIGNFVTSMKSSVFIKDANIVNTQSVVRESDKRRIDTFEVKFTIGSF